MALLGDAKSAEIGYHVAAALHDLGRNDEAARILELVLQGDAAFAGAEEAKALMQKIGN